MIIESGNSPAGTSRRRLADLISTTCVRPRRPCHKLYAAACNRAARLRECLRTIDSRSTCHALFEGEELELARQQRRGGAEQHTACNPGHVLRRLKPALVGGLMGATLAIAHVAAAQSLADLSLAVAASDPAPVVGADVTFTLTVANAGPSAAKRIVVRDRLPTGYTYVSHQATRGTYDSSNGRWSGVAVGARGSTTLTLTATVNAGGNYTNVAEIMSSSVPDPDSTPGNGNAAEDDYASVTTAPRSVDSAPNFIVFMVDDLDTRSLDDLLAAGLMPNLAARIIDRGVTFTGAYVSTPLCCPSRSTFFKGQYPHNTGIVSNMLLTPGFGMQWAVSQFDDSVTLATRLQALGYTTAHVGKYLNGYGSDPTLVSLNPAFDPHYVPPGWSHWEALVDFTTYCVYNYTISSNGVLTRYDRPPGQAESSELYQTNVLADLAESFVLEHVGDSEPFYLEVMPLAPHLETCADAYGGPPPDGDGFGGRIRFAPEDAAVPVPAFVPSASYDEDLADKPSWLSWTPPLTPDDGANIAEQFQGRLRAMLAVDRLIGRVVAALGPSIDETTIIFTSDNGFFFGEHRQTEKIYAYRESSRVPLYISVAGSSTPATRANLTLNNDLAPTILDLAAPGYQDPSFDGRSLVPILLDPQPAGWQDRAQFLIEFGRSARDADHDAHPTYAALRSDDRMYVESFDGMYYDDAPPLIGLELYDLVNDPNEMTSLLHFPEDVRDPLLGLWLDLLRDCSGQSCRDAEDTLIR